MFIITSTPQLHFLSSYYFIDSETCKDFINILKSLYKDYIFMIIEPSIVSKSKKINNFTDSINRVIYSNSPNLFNFNF